MNRILKMIVVGWLLLVTTYCTPNATPVVDAQSVADEGVTIVAPTETAVQVQNTEPPQTPVQSPEVTVTEPSEQVTEQATTATPTYLPYIQRITSTPPTPSSSIIANHTVIAQFGSIPDSALSAASAKKVLFYHQSTGLNITYYWQECILYHTDVPGLPGECLAYSKNPAKYDWANWAWQQWPSPQANAINKMTQFTELVPENQQGYDYIGMKFCYVDGWNQDFENYRVKMEALEKAYPGKVFIWATSALWGEVNSACTNGSFNSCELIQNFNNKLRAYAKANNKPLYDIAAIESNGGACKVAGYEGLCSEYYTPGDGGGHPNAAASVRLAKGFWWLVARLSGWKP